MGEPGAQRLGDADTRVLGEMTVALEHAFRSCKEWTGQPLFARRARPASHAVTLQKVREPDRDRCPITLDGGVAFS
jgi:hypothetical protein